MSLMVIDGNVQNLVHGLNVLRVGVIHILCTEDLHKEEAAREDEKTDAVDEEKILVVIN